MKFSVDVDSSTTATPATFSPFCRFCITPGCSGLLLAAIQFRPSHQTRCHSLQHFRRDAATRDAATQFSRPSRRHIVARRSLHDDSCEARNWRIIGFQRIHCSSRIHDFLAGGIVQKRATAPVFKKTLPHGIHVWCIIPTCTNRIIPKCGQVWHTLILCPTRNPHVFFVGKKPNPLSRKLRLRTCSHAFILWHKCGESLKPGQRISRGLGKR